MLDSNNVYVGVDDVTAWPGHIEIAASLGCVKFNASLTAKGRIRALAGSGIEAGEGIEAGWGIKAGFAIIANHISARLRIFAGLCSWRIPEPSEMEIRAEIRSGKVAFGTHVPPRDRQLSKSGTQ